MRRLPVVILLPVLMVCAVVSGCGEKKQDVIKGEIDVENFATMTTLNVSTVISDSGITRYKITAPIWLVFDEAREPRWTFPQSLHLEKYDDFYRVDATVDCDSATYFKDKQLWRLDGYVKISNVANEKFLTNQLYWDQRKQKIYSDSFIHIERADRVIEGYGFESNDRMTRYYVKQVSGIFPVEQFTGSEDGAEADEQTDSAATAPKARNSAARPAPGVRPGPGLQGDSTSRGPMPMRPRRNIKTFQLDPSLRQ